jgi:hypothetical protein
MFVKRLTAVRSHVEILGLLQLSYLGRLHIAKHVLDSSLYFHASFMLLPEDILDPVAECIDRFVARGHWEEGAEPPMSRVPGVAVEWLAWVAGGLNRLDVVAQVQALQAKVAALLLHPRRHPSKVLMRAAFSRQVPGLGYAVLLSRLEPRCGSGRLDRHVGYWRALHNIRPHRLLPAAKWSVWHMLHEPVASNCQLATEDRPKGLLASGSRLKRFAEACQLPAAGQPVTLPKPPAHLPGGPCFLGLPAGQPPAAACQTAGLAGLAVKV